jgi:microcystin-dependent protein
MPIESANYVNQLNSAYPAATDGVKEGDDHIRLVKKVLKDTFPNLDAAVTKTATQLNYEPREMPIGGIIMWSGVIGSLPTNYVLCNGQTVARSDGAGNITTPDLRNRFIVGAGDTYSIGNTGGANEVTLTTAQIPAHTHSITASGSTGAAGAHNHSVYDPGHSHSVALAASDRTGAGTGAILGPAVTTIYPGTTAAGTGISLYGVGDHTHSLSISVSAANTGGGTSHENRPPYFALAYIMRI